jgi:hypothetical protein
LQERERQHEAAMELLKAQIAQSQPQPAPMQPQIGIPLQQGP